MFKERYLIQKEPGALEKVTTALDIRNSPTEVAEKVTHNSEYSTNWNNRQLDLAKKAEVNIKEVNTATRKGIGEVFSHLGKSGRKLASSLLRPAIYYPLKAVSKVTQTVKHAGELAFSGALVIHKEIWNALEYPLILAKEYGTRFLNVIDGHSAHAGAP